MILIKKAEEISEYRKVLGSLKEQLVKEIEEAPAGRLRISEKGNRVVYYYCKEGAGYGSVYPDFTILNKHTMEIVWLEHCGRMGDAEYTAKMVVKVRSYEKSDIYVGRNLYLTFETLETPFDAGSIEAIFEKFA